VKKLFVLILAGLIGATVLTTTVGCPEKKADDKKTPAAGAAPAATDKDKDKDKGK